LTALFLVLAPIHPGGIFELQYGKLLVIGGQFWVVLQRRLPNTPTLQQANQRKPGTLDEGLTGRNPSYACGEAIGISTVASSHERDNVVPGPNYRTLGANDGEENLEQTDGHPIEEWTANTPTRHSPPLLRLVGTCGISKIQSTGSGMINSSSLSVESEPTFILSHNKFWRASMAIILKAFRDVQSEGHDIDFRDLFLRESSVFGFSHDSLANILRDIEDSDSGTGTGTLKSTDFSASNLVDGGFEFSLTSIHQMLPPRSRFSTQL